MKKKYMILILLLIILLGAFYWFWQSKKDKGEVVSDTTGDEIIPSTSTNPLDNKPNINPIDQTNPFKNIKTNPFE
jgi:hypothetical protein